MSFSVVPLWGMIKRLFELSNTQEIALAGALPSACGFSDSIHSCKEYGLLESSQPLAIRLESGKPRVVVFLVGMGTPGGFLLPTGPEGGVLPDSWWAIEGAQSVGLFAFACHSSEYLEKAEVTDFLQGALCYNGEVWLSVCDSVFWKSLWLRLRAIIKGRGQLDKLVLTLIREEYDRQIRRAARKKIAYLTLLCLVEQKETLQLLRGGRS